MKFGLGFLMLAILIGATFEFSWDAKAEALFYPALVILSTEDFSSMNSIVQNIQNLGGRVLHIFPTHVLIVEITSNIEGDLLGEDVVGIYKEEVEPTDFEIYGIDAMMGAEAWNNNFMGGDVDKGLDLPDYPEPEPILEDARVPPNSGENERIGDSPYGAGLNDTSEYMMGVISVTIIFPESNGTLDPETEDWTSSEESNVTSEVTAAMNWWGARDSRADLSFIYHFYYSQETSYEPISRSSWDEGLWIEEIMGNLGYNSGDYFDRIYEYLSDTIDSDGSDWGFVIFVVDSSNDSDDSFANGAFAYAYIGGPLMVMTYGNNGYGIDDMDSVAAHEMGHIFYALDQYSSSGCTCTERSGYLNVENQNCENSCSLNTESIMRGGVTSYTNGSVDSYAREQIGWRDTDSDGIFDILDTFPNSILNPYTPNPTTDNTPTYSGNAIVQPYPNQNPAVWNDGNDITLNVISLVQYRVDGGGWMDASPSDGAFDEPIEDFTFTTSPLEDGTHTIEVRAQNSQTNWETTYSQDTITIQFPGELSSWIVATPESLNLGEIITVTMTVQNTGGTQINSVTPSSLTLGGEGLVTLTSGPDPTSSDIPSGASQDFIWTFSTDAEGVVNFAGNASGIDSLTEDIVSSVPTLSNNVEISSEPEFEITAEPLTQTVSPGDSASYTLSINALGSFNSPVSFTLSGLPLQSLKNFSKNPVLPDESSFLTISTSSQTPDGEYIMTLRGFGEGITRTIELTLIVVSEPDFTISAYPTSKDVDSEGFASYTLHLQALNGFDSVVELYVEGLPEGTSFTFSDEYPTPPTSVTLIFETSGSTSLGTFTLTIMGIGGEKSHSVEITLRKLEERVDFELEAGENVIAGGYTLTLTEIQEGVLSFMLSKDSEILDEFSSDGFSPSSMTLVYVYNSGDDRIVMVIKKDVEKASGFIKLRTLNQVGKHAPGKIIQSSWATTTPNIDGVISTNEWADATLVDITSSFFAPPNPVRMYVKNDEQTLYLAFDDPNDTTNAGSGSEVGIYFDDEPTKVHDGAWTYLSCPADEGNFWIDTMPSAPRPNTFRGIAQGPTFCCTPFVDCSAATGVTSSSSHIVGNAQHEVAIDLSTSNLKASEGDTIGFWFFVLDNDTFVPNGDWLDLISLGTWDDPSTYGDLTLATKPPSMFAAPLQSPTSIRPLVNKRIRDSKDLREEIESLKERARLEDIDLSECLSSEEEMLRLLKEGEKYFWGGNFIVANNKVLDALELLDEMKACLEDLLKPGEVQGEVSGSVADASFSKGTPEGPPAKEPPSSEEKEIEEIKTQVQKTPKPENIPNVSSILEKLKGFESYWMHGVAILFGFLFLVFAFQRTIHPKERAQKKLKSENIFFGRSYKNEVLREMRRLDLSFEMGVIDKETYLEALKRMADEVYWRLEASEIEKREYLEILKAYTEYVKKRNFA